MTFSDHARTDEPTPGALVHDLSQQIPELIRSELRLAQAEVAEKGKRAGIAMLGKNQASQATPPLPERAVEGVEEDIATIKGDRS